MPLRYYTSSVLARFPFSSLGSIIFKHYRELATEDAADQWFGILPKPGQWQNTITYNRLTRTVTLPE